MRKLFLLPATALLGACQTQAPEGSNMPATQQPSGNAHSGSPDVPVSDSQPPVADTRGNSGSLPSSDCGIIESSGWAAWVDAMPGPNSNPRLIVTGKVTVPTGGYRFEWGDFRVAESYPVQVFGELRAIPPAGAATQAVTTHDVRGEWPTSPPVGSLSISCGNRLLARIAPVETAH